MKLITGKRRQIEDTLPKKKRKKTNRRSQRQKMISTILIRVYIMMVRIRMYKPYRNHIPESEREELSQFVRSERENKGFYAALYKCVRQFINLYLFVHQFHIKPLALNN